jgi:hypothetical protein
MKTILTAFLLTVSNSLLADPVYLADKIVSIPEPAVYALIGIGVAGIVLARRRKK